MLRHVMPALCSGWLVGIAWGSVLSPLPRWQILLAGTASVLSVGLLRGTQGRIVGLALLTLLLGALHADHALRSDAAIRMAWREIGGRGVFEGTIRAREDRGTLAVLDVGDIRETLRQKNLPGLLRASVPSETSAIEGAAVRLRGTVVFPENRPQETGHFDAERFFARHGIIATMSHPRVVVQEPGTPSLLSRVRLTLRAQLHHALPEPSAGVLSALVLSFDHDMAPKLREAFALSGLAHLIAISGSHIALLTGALFLVGSAMGLSRVVASVLAIVLSVMFLALVGFPASGVRSVIMAGLVLWSYAAGRRVPGVRVLLIAAAAMTVANPRLLLGDVGFQLSVLAMWGLLVLFPLFHELLPGRRNVLGIRTLLLLTVAAEVATLPLVAYVFGRISLVGLATNLLAVPLFPLLLIGGTLVAAGGFLPFITVLIVPPVHTVTLLFVRLAEVSAALPGAWFAVPQFSLFLLVLSYGVLFSFPFFRVYLFSSTLGRQHP